MKNAAKFYKVSKEQFVGDWTKTFPGTDAEHAEEIYCSIKLPKRATAGSAGYDFYAPEEIVLNPGESIRIPTGIGALMNEDWVLMLFPRSGLGFKYRLQLDNTVGVIDSDYCHSDNEGHIQIKITNDTKEGKTVIIPAGSGIAQGIFLPYGITDEDDATAIRNGGFGSTNKN